MHSSRPRFAPDAQPHPFDEARRLMCPRLRCSLALLESAVATLHAADELLEELAVDDPDFAWEADALATLHADALRLQAHAAERAAVLTMLRHTEHFIGRGLLTPAECEQLTARVSAGGNLASHFDETTRTPARGGAA